MSIGARLKEERERLGLTQVRMAELASASKWTQLQWEKGSATPNAAALVTFLRAGADVFYVLSGLRLDAQLLDAFRRAAEATHSAAVTLEERRELEEELSKAITKQIEHSRAGARPASADGAYMLSADERAIIDRYRAASKEGRRLLDAASESLTPAKKRGKR